MDFLTGIIAISGSTAIAILVVYLILIFISNLVDSRKEKREKK